MAWREPREGAGLGALQGTQDASQALDPRRPPAPTAGSSSLRTGSNARGPEAAAAARPPLRSRSASASRDLGPRGPASDRRVPGGPPVPWSGKRLVPAS